jgi:Type IV secretory pathway, VirB3-like protein
VSQEGKVPADALEPLPSGLWKPMTWAYCEGAPMGFVTVITVIGLLIVRTPSAMSAAALFFALSWWALRALAERDPRAWRVFKRARRFRNGRTATLPARASWGSPHVRWPSRKH